MFDVIAYSLVSCFTETVEFEPPGSESEEEENDDDNDESEGEGLWALISKTFTAVQKLHLLTPPRKAWLKLIIFTNWLHARAVLVRTRVMSINRGPINYSLVNASMQVKLLIIGFFQQNRVLFPFLCGFELVTFPFTLPLTPVSEFLFLDK